MKKFNRFIILTLALLTPLGVIDIVNATTYTSTHYEVNQLFFGSGGNSQCSTFYSTSFCAQTALGEVGVGNTKGTAYQAYSGYNTNDEPYLQFIVNSSSTPLGYLSTSSVATASGTFSVRDYLSQGYIVELDSTPPSIPSHTMTALSSPTLSTPGTEQFGANLVYNTSPSVGSNPVQQPSSAFSFGTVTAGASGPNGATIAAGYDTQNYFKYVNNDIIAASNQSSGETDYTISYIFNISSTTAAGAYTFNQVLICLPTY